MLYEIRSDVFRTKQIRFHDGLNVVLGDENATNSIGKSSLLMVVDFAFGGNDLLTHNTDLVKELGHHDYTFTFQLDGSMYRFRRATSEPDTVHFCNEDFEPESTMRLEDFRAFLMKSYGIALPDVTFRMLVGLCMRVWGKDNLNVDRPLHVVQRQSGKECVDHLIKIFGRYGDIKSLSEALLGAEARRSALTAAVRNQIVHQIGKRGFAENSKRIGQLERDLMDIRQNLAKYATNISEVVNKEVLQLKVEKDELLALRLNLSGRLLRVQKNLAEDRYIKSRHFNGLLEFFPEVDRSRLAKIEEFHSEVAKLLRAELKDSEKSLLGDIKRIDDAVHEIDRRMATALRSVDQPTVLVDRVYGIATALQTARAENERYEKEQELKQLIDELRDQLEHEKTKVLDDVESTLNEGLRTVVTTVFGPDRKSPRIKLREGNYSYEVFDDTGTGTAYASLIVLDLTLFKATSIPIVAHDSLLFKNIENDSAARLFQVYSQVEKQSFVAIDEVEKYGADTAALLRDKGVIQLDSEHVLYVKDWRRKA